MIILKDDIEVVANVEIIARERGKIVDRREDHNIFVNLGREYLADRVHNTSAEWIKWMGLGIGSDEQTVDIAANYATLDSAYKGQNIFSDSDPTITVLERPVKLQNGTLNYWLLAATLSQPIATTAKFVYSFSETDINLTGLYPVVPISEAGLYLDGQTQTTNPYTGGTIPDWIGPSRQTLVAYNGFAPISKTPSIAVEVRWELRF
jgi:hypothetical protein